MSKKQSAWMYDQKINMEHLNDKFEHIVVILRKEIAREHERESGLLRSTKMNSRLEKMAIWQDRFESIDRVRFTLESYGFIGAYIYM
jgi:hypothetical protein